MIPGEYIIPLCEKKQFFRFFPHGIRFLWQYLVFKLKSMPFIRAWFHLVWATKNRQPLLIKEIRQTIFDHIKQNAREKGIFLDSVNGHQDHIHCLLSLSADQTLSKVLQLIKGESSFWINRNKLSDSHFEWQDEYFAVSVSHENAGKVRAYIQNQENHHQQQRFQQEYDDFIRKYEWEKITGC